MTFLPTEVAGRWFYLYLILDVYSRKVVAFGVHEDDDNDHAARLVQRAALAEGLLGLPRDQWPVLHGDNGATLKATTVLAILHWLGVKPSYSRPRVSDDNAFAESLFRTAKYRPEFPSTGFASVADARDWARRFVHWYNHEYRHSGIRYVSPAQRLMRAKTRPSWKAVTGSTKRPACATRRAGQARPATGNTSLW